MNCTNIRMCELYQQDIQKWSFLGFMVDLLMLISLGQMKANQNDRAPVK